MSRLRPSALRSGPGSPWCLVGVLAVRGVTRSVDPASDDERDELGSDFTPFSGKGVKVGRHGFVPLN